MYVCGYYIVLCLYIFVLLQQQICIPEESEEQAVMSNWVEAEDEKRTRNLN